MYNDKTILHPTEEPCLHFKTLLHKVWTSDITSLRSCSQTVQMTWQNHSRNVGELVKHTSVTLQLLVLKSKAFQTTEAYK